MSTEHGRSPAQDRTKDISVLQLLTRLVKETDRIIHLADDIDQHATTPQAKAALSLIGSEVNNILTLLSASLDPLYRLYELDPGMKASQGSRQFQNSTETLDDQDIYDENALWADMKSKGQTQKPTSVD